MFALANVGTGVLDGPRAKEMLERIWNVKNIVAPMFVQTYFTYTDSLRTRFAHKVASDQACPYGWRFYIFFRGGHAIA